MEQALHQILNKMDDRALIYDRTGNALRNFYPVLNGEVSLSSPFFHGFMRCHSSVFFTAYAAFIKIFAWGLTGAGKQTAHHNGAGAEGYRLDNMSYMGYTTIRYNRDIRVFFRELCRVINCRTLRPSNRKGILCNTNRTATHAASAGMNAGIDQCFALFCG